MKVANSHSVLSERTVHLYGWERDGQYWHGPTEITPCTSLRAFRQLQAAQGFWFGKSRYTVPGGPPVAFCNMLRDLGDCAIASIDVEGEPRGPLEVVAVIPDVRTLRPEFAFEFTSLLRFIEGPVSTGSELAIHDHLQSIIETDRDSSLVLAMDVNPCLPDIEITLSEHIERLATAMLAWMDCGRTPAATQMLEAAGASR